MWLVGMGEISTDFDESQLGVVFLDWVSRMILIWLSSLYGDQPSRMISIPESESYE